MVRNLRYPEEGVMADTKIVHLVPEFQAGTQQIICAFYGLDANGAMWYGTWSTTRQDGGPAEIVWRPINTRTV